ncbi:zinc finger transcription factor Trps1-like [Coccinella septempunctata]|uniref:zinc finger transcription factor Trps1-like n=1 Tax=Coccinella septempunctata TaxID=41139 RepID=UPI001D081B5A|nr:zinc finger transcription factor Trps1-like [Coccinella septempunctata]
MAEHCNYIKEKVYITCDEVKLEEKSGIVDIFEQYIDEEGVHDREEYIIKNEENDTKPLFEELNANHSSSAILIEEVYSAGEEKYPDKHMQCNHTAKTEVDKKWHVKSPLLNIKNCKCPLCDFETNYKEDLALHIKSVHSSIKCDSCEFVTSEKDNLKQHADSVHFKQRCTDVTIRDNPEDVLKEFSIHEEKTGDWTIESCDWSLVA